VLVKNGLKRIRHKLEDNTNVYPGERDWICEENLSGSGHGKAVGFCADYNEL
jgi:hypothetical protein